MQVHNNLYSFFFEADAEYSNKYEKNIVKTLLNLTKNHNIESRFYFGDLTLISISSRISKVTFDCDTEKLQPILRYMMCIDKDLLKSLSWELYDSLCAEYCTFDEEFYPLLFSKKDIYVFSISNIDDTVSNIIDSELRGHDGYLGAAKCDLANPLHFELFSANMLDNWYFSEKILYYKESYGDPKAYYPNWAEEVGIEIKGISNFKYDSTVPKVVLEQPLSERGQLYINIYQQRMENVNSQIVQGLINNFFASKVVTDGFTFNANEEFSFKNIIIPKNKLVGYALNKNHEDGRHKAVLFERLLGITANNSDYLSAQILEGLLNGVLQGTRKTKFGIQYHVDIQVKGINDETKTVRTGWIIKDESTVSLTTAYIVDGNKQKDTEAMDLIYINNTFNNQDDYFRAIFEFAQIKGDEAMEKTIPVPLFLSETKTPIIDGVSGIANVILEGKYPFIKWLKNNDIGYKHHKKGWVIPGSSSVVSFHKQLAYCEVISKILEVNGIDNRVEKRLD